MAGHATHPRATPPHRGRGGAHLQPGPSPHPHRPPPPRCPRSARQPTPSLSHETYSRAFPLRPSAHPTTSLASPRDPLPPHPRVTTPAVSVALFLIPPHYRPPPFPHLVAPVASSVCWIPRANLPAPSPRLAAPLHHRVAPGAAAACWPTRNPVSTEDPAAAVLLRVRARVPHLDGRRGDHVPHRRGPPARVHRPVDVGAGVGARGGASGRNREPCLRDVLKDRPGPPRQPIREAYNRDAPRPHPVL